MENPFGVKEQIGVQDKHQDNIQPCQKLVKAWIDNPKAKSLDVLPRLYTELFGVTQLYDDPRFGVVFSEVSRKEDVVLLGHPDAIIAPYDYINQLMYKYTDELDKTLEDLPRSPLGHIEKISHDAAKAYYIFDVIHPFEDGNGRLGRMIVKRILKGAGVRDIIYHSDTWYGKERSEHFESLSKVNVTGNLANLEVNLLISLRNKYLSPNDKTIRDQIDSVLKEKKEEIKNSTGKKSLSEIWDGFAILGNI